MRKLSLRQARTILRLAEPMHTTFSIVRIEPWRVCVSLLICALAGCATVPGAPDPVIARSLTENTAARIVVTVRNPPVRTAQHAGSTPKAYDATGRYQVSPVASRESAALAATHRLQRIAEWPIDLLGVHCIVYELPDASAKAAVITALRRDPRVESVQPLNTFTAQTATNYNDQYAPLQNSLRTLGIEAAHLQTRGRGVRIAVIDTGLDTTHPDLQGRIAVNRDFVGNGPHVEAHGTAMAGIIAANANNSLGIVGVAPEARVLALRACWETDTTANGRARCNTFTLAQAIAFAITERADILNMSLAGPTDPLLERLLARALRLGRIVVGAWPESVAGLASFPASMPGVIAVGTDASEDSNDVGRLRASGREVLTLQPLGRYDFASGSSIAAAQVAGIAALIRARHSSLTSGALQRALLESQHKSKVRMVNACDALATFVARVDCGTPD